MIKVAPSILSADFTKIYEAVRMLEESGADYIHCDVMDGMFVPNITFGQKMVNDIRRHTKLILDVHLMINSPERYIDEFAMAGADIITVQAEACVHLDRIVQQIKYNGKKCGVALNPHTPVCVLENILAQIDMVLLMSVNPGFGGQSFIPYVLDKAKALRKIIKENSYAIDIEMDGGLGPHNVRDAVEAGVNVIVAGNAVFTAESMTEAISRLRLEK